MNRTNRKLALSLALSLAVPVSGALAQPDDRDAPALPDDLPINRIQVLGTHNSYSQPIDPRLREMAAPVFSKLSSMMAAMPAEKRALFQEEHPNPISIDEGFNYAHGDLVSQLDLGLRSLELDINPDPDGGHYLDPAGYRALVKQGVQHLLPFDRESLAKPGFKVFHVADFDFRSHCALFTQCLHEIRDWSDAHPGHVPLFILVEAKSQALPLFADGTPPVPFTAQRFDEIDQEILSVFPRDRIVTPDDVRGQYPTLNAAVLAGNWPKLGAARGKVMFLMLTANGPEGAAGYLAGHPSLKGRVAFLRAEPGEDHAAFLMYDNALVRAAEIRKYTAQGYLVRTRSDIETYEAKSNDSTRATAALASGAQIVSTDFEQAGNIYVTPYKVSLPGGGAARLAPTKP
ncbi:Ca2+-dependent phosphoinositide-specific phospholipase C [Novosphingobium sp. BL-8H]|uniref:Ca2+-dependent phosphoinositide-specific phospholipase C n=1 Tax=Novosphingobium sp. BL-8H TaxID=3127640 RepID=UPI00375784EF